LNETDAKRQLPLSSRDFSLFLVSHILQVPTSPTWIAEDVGGIGPLLSHVRDWGGANQCFHLRSDICYNFDLKCGQKEKKTNKKWA
jgi:hypothetical protein